MRVKISFDINGNLQFVSLFIKYLEVFYRNVCKRESQLIDSFVFNLFFTLRMNVNCFKHALLICRFGLEFYF